MRAVLIAATLLATLPGLSGPLRAAGCSDNLLACLVYGRPQPADTPRQWDFDPDSGFTLGRSPDPSSAPSDTLDCLRGGIVFLPSGRMEFGRSAGAGGPCQSAGQQAVWEETRDSRTGEIGITIRHGAERCRFSVAVDPEHPETLLLTTPCRQQPGHPVQFRYFLGDPR